MENPNSPEAVGRRLRTLRIITMGGEDNQTAWCLSFNDPAFTTSSWGNWERGRNRPMPHTLQKILRRTRATSDYVIYGKTDSLPYDLVRAIEALEAREVKKGAA